MSPISQASGHTPLVAETIVKTIPSGFARYSAQPSTNNTSERYRSEDFRSSGGSLWFGVCCRHFSEFAANRGRIPTRWAGRRSGRWTCDCQWPNITTLGARWRSKNVAGRLSVSTSTSYGSSSMPRRASPVVIIDNLIRPVYERRKGPRRRVFSSNQVDLNANNFSALNHDLDSAARGFACRRMRFLHWMNWPEK